MTYQFTNNAATTLASGITNVATSLTVATGAGALFPTPSGAQYFVCTLVNAAGTVREIVKVTARTGDVFTIVRGQEGTSAVAWNTGDKVELRLTAGGLGNFGQIDTANTWSLGQTFSSAATFSVAPIFSSLTGVLLGAGASAATAVAPGTSGNILTSNGITWVSQTPAASWVGNSGQVFTASGTFTIPTGVTKLKATVTGGGGGGNGTFQTNSTYGLSGGSGATSISFLTGLTPGNTITVTVGAAGAYNTSGGTSSISSGTQTITTVSATGGSVGSSLTSSSLPVGNYAGGAGGAATGGTINIAGTIGGGIASISDSGICTTGYFIIGPGGASYWGSGGRGATSSSDKGIFWDGVPAQAYGAGGSGNGYNASSVNTTNIGGAGIVVFEW